MSNIFVRDIVGSSGGDLKVPTNDTELATATSRLATQINTIANFTYDSVLAWVETKDGGSAPRTLNCAIQGFTYFVEECPDATEVGTMTAAVKAAIEAYDSPNTTVGEQQVSLFQVSQVAPWIRDPAGFIYPNVATDDLYIGGSSPNGVWKNDGDLVLGAASMFGTEVLRVVGDARVEGKLTVTGLIDPTGLVLDEQASVPGGAPAAGKGTVWVKNDTPNTVWFTDDGGTNHQLGVWSAAASVVYPTAFATDKVVVGSNAMSGSEIFRVYGNALVDGGQLGIHTAPITSALIKAQDDLSTTSSTIGLWAYQSATVSVTKTSWTGLLVQGGHASTGAITASYGVDVDHLLAAGSAGSIGTAYGFRTTATLSNAGDTVTTYKGLECSATSGVGAIATAYGLDVADQGLSSTTTYGVRIQDQTGTTAYGIYQAGTDDLNVFLGDVAVGVTTMSGAEKLRVSGDVRVDLNGQILIADSGTDAPLNITERSAAPSAPAANDIYLDDGTNTASGNPGWRRYTGAVWEDISAGGGGASPWSYSAGVIYPTNDVDDDTVAIGTNAMSGTLNEMMHVLCDSKISENEQTGILADHVETDFSATAWKGFVARGTTTFGSSGSWRGFAVVAPAAGQYGGWNVAGFHYPNMAGTGFSGSTGFLQEGVGETNAFYGRTGLGGGVQTATTATISVPSNAFTTPWLSLKIDRTGDNSTSSPGSSSDWYGIDLSLTQNSAGAAAARYIQNLRYINTVAPTAPPTRPLTIENAYGLYVDNFSGGANVSYTNTPYGIYQEGSGDKNYFAGHTGIGTTPSTGSMVEVVDSFTGTESDIAGVESSVSVSSNSAQRNAAVRGYIQVSTGVSLLTNAYGVYGRAIAQGTAAASNLIAVHGDVIANGSGSVSGYSLRGRAVIAASASMSAYRGVFIENPIVNTLGTIATAYGIEIGDLRQTGVTASFGVYQSGTQDTNFFNADVGIGTSIPSHKLDVVGNIRAQTQFVLPSYAKAGLPASPVTGGLIYVTDETGGAVPAFYDGTNWRRVTDRAIVS